MVLRRYSWYVFHYNQLGMHRNCTYKIKKLKKGVGIAIKSNTLCTCKQQENMRDDTYALFNNVDWCSYNIAIDEVNHF